MFLLAELTKEITVVCATFLFAKNLNIYASQWLVKMEKTIYNK